MHKRLGLNIDHVATLREARKEIFPDPIAAALIAENAGVDGIVCHLREDRRHINDRDLEILKQVVKTHLNLEMANTKEMVEIACRTLPNMSTIVPEKRQEITTEGGLDVVGNFESLKENIAKLKASGIVVSLFIDADEEQIRASKEVGATVIELHTGAFANAKNKIQKEKEIQKLIRCSILGNQIGLQISLGHGIDYNNVYEILKVPHVEEYNIGFSIIAKSVFVGLENAVREMSDLINGKNNE